MTYCLAIRLDEGLVFLGDSRTNAGVDNVSTYRKVHHMQAGVGHYGVFSGRRWNNEIYPLLRDFVHVNS